MSQLCTTLFAALFTARDDAAAWSDIPEADASSVQPPAESMTQSDGDEPRRESLFHVDMANYA